MGRLAVSLLEMNYCSLEEALDEAERAGIDYIHIDVMDGSFVPSLGIGTKLIEGIRRASKLPFDVHMMVEEPGRFAERMAQAGADVLSVHYEACRDLLGTLKQIKALGLKVGVDLNPDTSIDALDDEVLRKADVLQIMTTYPGREGQKFIPASLERIAALRKRLDGLALQTDIEVDGNITRDNIGAVVAAGATIIVSGRALANGDMTENVRQMRSLMEKAEKGN